MYTKSDLVNRDTKMRVLSVGSAGRYGRMVCPKLPKLGIELSGAVDPKFKIEEIRQSTSNLLGNTPIYTQLSEVPVETIRDSVIDVELIPQVVPKVFKYLIDRGAKRIILPKPVAITKKEYDEMMEYAEKNKTKAIIASNWYYSEITKKTKALLDRLTNGNISSDIKDDNFTQFLKKVDLYLSQ